MALNCCKSETSLSPFTNRQYKERMKYLYHVLHRKTKRAIRQASDEKLEMEEIRQYVDTQKKKIDEEMELKRFELIKKDRTVMSQYKTKMKLEVLGALNKEINGVIEAATKRLKSVDDHRQSYRRVLYDLLVQALTMLMEDVVLVRFREKDANLGKTVFKYAQSRYKKMSSSRVKLMVSKEYLDESSYGGLDVCSINGQVFVQNSLYMRLMEVVSKSYPMIRVSLIGLNPSRRNYDMSPVNPTHALFSLEKLRVDLYKGNMKNGGRSVLGLKSEDDFPYE